MNEENLLKLYPEYDKILGPYNRKDGRQHIILNCSSKNKKDKTKLKTISYPKALFESYFNKLLLPDETIDHRDKNPLNNEISNLRILKRSDHSKLDVIRRVLIEEAFCGYCGISFIPTISQLSLNKQNWFCSNVCSGKYGVEVQNQRKEKTYKNIQPTYYCLKEFE